MLIGAFAIAGTTALGFWQLRRAAVKEVLQSEIEQSARAQPVTLGAAALAHPDTMIHKHIRLRGHWLADHVIYLDNRPQAGRAGFYVLMPLHIDGPVPAEVIVNRGWLPRDFNDRRRIASYRTPAMMVTVSGVALAEEPRLLELAREVDQKLGGIWQNFDFDAYARASGGTPLRLVIREDRKTALTSQATDDSEADGLDRDWPDRGGVLQAQIDRHHGYAFQWFALAATLMALLAFQFARLIKHARKHSA